MIVVERKTGKPVYPPFVINGNSYADNFYECLSAAEMEALGVAVVDGFQPIPDFTPNTITSKQLFQQLALDKLITWGEATAFQSSGVIPKIFADGFATIQNEDTRQQAIYEFVSAATYDLDNPNTQLIGAILGQSPTDLQTLWRRASSIR